MWPRDAYVGQRVVCIDDDWGGYAHSAVKMGCSLPQVGKIYTIRAIFASDFVTFYLEELVNPKVALYGAAEPGFCADQFRPVDESRLDVFREMLKRPGVWNHDENRKDVVREDALQSHRTTCS